MTGDGRPWRYRRQWRLPIARSIGETCSRLAQISQLPAEFSFPRRILSHGFHYTGPFRLASSRYIAFPYERLSGRPLIFASLGILQNRVRHIFTVIVAACAGLDAKLVIALGGGSRPEDLGDLPGRPLVSYAPQPALISRAVLDDHACRFEYGAQLTGPLRGCAIAAPDW